MLNEALDLRYANDAAKARKDAGKDTGIVRLHDNGYTVIAETAKQVHWDRDKLSQALNGLDNETAQHYGKWTLSVDERNYAAAPPEIKKALNSARTVVAGKSKYIIQISSKMEAA
jgi:hypothetical protein